MKIAGNLPSLNGTIPNALQLQRQVARAVGAVQVHAARTKVTPESAALLMDFFDKAKAQVAAIGVRVRSLVITPASPVVTVAAPTVQLVVTKVTNSGASSNVAPAASGTTYVSSNPAVATVSVNGLVTRVANGTATITATHLGVTATKAVSATA